jgi:predicted glycosyltransferase
VEGTRSVLADQVIDGSERSEKRALFFVFDGGTGVGHLRRLCCIARKLQGHFSCLIVTGHRAAAHWFVPEECEYVHIPSWDSLLPTKAKYWGRKPFITLSEGDAIKLRKGMLSAIVKSFAPDVIFVDHLPLGANEELADIIKETQCPKYLVTRGIQNETENLRGLIFGGAAHDYLENYYHKILVACDSNIFNFTQQYNLSPELSSKSFHTGYVIENVSQAMISKTREDRGLKGDDIWAVASAGGGQLGEALIERTIKLAGSAPGIKFDIVLGPRSNIRWDGAHRNAIHDGDNIRLHKGTGEMPYLHAGADLVISSGGYNSLLETLQGNAKILCFPVRKDRRDEQYRHATCLKKFVDIEVSTEVDDLPALFQGAVDSLEPGRHHDRRQELNFNGAACIEKIVHEDMRLIESNPLAPQRTQREEG